MRKLTLLIVSLLCCVGVLHAQALVADGVYTLSADVNMKRGELVAANGYDYPVLDGIDLSGYTQNSTAAQTNGQYWHVECVDASRNTYYIYNIAKGKYLVNENGNVNFGDNPYEWTFVKANNQAYLNIKDASRNSNVWLSSGCGRTASQRPVQWDSNNNDGGALYTFTRIGDCFATPVTGRFYKIKGTHSTNPWLTATVEGGGIDVAANEADAAVYLKTTNGLKAISTGKYIGTGGNGSQISLVDNEEDVTIEEAKACWVYIKTGGRYLYNNQPDYTREAGNLTAATFDAPMWGFIEVEAPAPTVAEVATLAELQAALAAENELPIIITAQIEIPAGETVTIDLNGKTVNSVFNGTSTTNHIYALSNKGTLTIQDSKGTGSINSRGIYNYGSLTLNAGAINAIDGNGGYAVNNQSGSTFVMNGGVVAATYEDDNQSSSGGYDATALKVPAGCEATLNGGIINNVCDFTFAIDAAGTLNIPETSTITVNGTHGAIAVSGGETTINAGTYTIPKDNYSRSDNVLYVSGGSLVVNGGTFIGDSDTASGGSCLYDAAGTAVVNGGTFKGSSGGDVWGTTGTTIKGGTFENLTEKQHIAAGYELNADGTVAAKPVAEVNGVKYVSFAEAVAAAQSGSEIKLLADVTLAERVTIPADKTLTIDLNGKSISMEESIIATAYAINNLGNLTIKDGVGGGSINARGIYNGYENVATAKITVLSGTINAKGTDGGAAIFNYGVADIQGGNFTSIGGYSLNNRSGASMTIADGVTANNGIYATDATLDVNGGEINGNRSGCHVLYAWNSNVTIDGGTFHNNNSGNSTIMSAGTSEVTINGGTISIKDGRVPGNGNTWTSCLTDAANTAKIIVNGGTFNGGFRVQGGATMTINSGSFNDVAGSGYNVYQGAIVEVKGGTFTDATAQTFAKNNIADDYKVGEDGKVVYAPVVAKIGETKYETLDEAVAAAKEGDKITLLNDAELLFASNPMYNNVYASEIDLNGKTMTIKKGDIRFDNVTIKNGNIVVQPGTYSGTAIFLMYSKNLTLDGVKVTATGVASTYLIGLEGTSNLNLLNGSEIVINNESLVNIGSIIADNGNGNTVTIKDSKIDVKNSNARLYLGGTNGKITVENSDIDLNNVKDGFYLRAGQTLAITGTSTVDITLITNEGRYGINLTDITATYTKAETATVNATLKEVTPAAVIGAQKFATLQAAINAVQNGETITLIADCAEVVSINKSNVAFTIDGAQKTYTGKIQININQNVTVKNVKFVHTADDAVDFIANVGSPTGKNYNTTLLVDGCTFTGNGKANVVAVRTTHPTLVTIQNTTGTGLHSMLQNTGGQAVTVDGVTVAESKGGLAIGSPNGQVAVKNSNLTTATYGVRLDANNTNAPGAVLENNNINAYIPVSVRKATANYNLTFNGENSAYTATNGDNVWCAICTTEYEEGVALNEPTGKVRVTLNDETLTAAGVYGDYVPVAKIGDVEYTSLEEAFAAATEGQTITLLDNATPALASQRAITKAAVIDLGGKTLTLTEDDLYFGTTTFKNGTIVVDPSVKPSTAVFWMFANQTLTFDAVKVVATGVTGTYLIGLEGENSDLNLLNGSEILVENTTALDLDIICVNGTNTCDIKVENSKVNVTNLDGRVFFRGNYTVAGNSEINLVGITKAGFRIEAGQTLSIEGTSKVNIEGEPRDGGIHLTDLTATYTKAETATVNATLNRPAVAKIGDTPYYSLAEALAAVTDDAQTVVVLRDVTENLTGAYLRGNITTENGAKVTITLTNSDWVYCPYTFVIGENVTLKVPALFYYAGGTQINGTVIADAYYQRYANTKLTINEPGSMTVTTEQFYLRNTDNDANAGIYINGDNNDETIGLNLAVAYFYQGMINAKNANIKAGTYWQTNETDGQGSANLVLDNSKLVVSVYDHPAKATGNSTVTLTNGSVIDAKNGGFTYGDNTTLSVDATSKIIGKNGALVELPVATINGKKYITLQAAVDAVKDGETITLLADVAENVTLTEKVGLHYTIDGAGKTMNGKIVITPLSDENDNRRITIKNINFVDTVNGRDFITSVNTNHYPRLTVESCSFTGTGKEAANSVAIRLKSSHSVVIKNCTGTALHSFLQNTSGWNLTIENVSVTESKSAFALGTVQGVTVKGCTADVDGYGIRMDAQYNNNAVLESNTIKAFIPVVVRKASVESNIEVKGTNNLTATNGDGIWFAAGTSEYETNGQMPTATTAKVLLVVNDENVDIKKAYGNYVEPVAKVGDKEFGYIEDAIAAWTNNTTLTLLADVTLSDVVKLKSTEHHYLDLATYTMTAASGKNAIEIVAYGTGDAERGALTITADANNPGGINAGNKSIVYYDYSSGQTSGNDRPIIYIKGGVFTGSTSGFGTYGIYTKGTASRKCATLNISGGTFNCSIYGSGKSKLLISGGVFNYSVGSQGDSTALRLISGGTFKSFGFMTADSNNTKFWIGTAMGTSNVGVYVDDNGYIVVGGSVVTEAGETFEASSTNYSGASTYLQYSSAKDNGLYYTAAEEALKDNSNKANAVVTVYADEVDMTGINYTGTIVIPAGETVTIANAPANLKVETTEGNFVVNNNGTFQSLPVAVKIADNAYASIAEALVAAQNANLTEVVITIVGENTAATADKFNLYQKSIFDKVTFKQENGNKPYYFEELYTGSRTNNGKFVFDGVNIAVTGNGQYILEGNVVLSNNSYIKSNAEANCFVYNAEVTVEAGSKIDGVIEDIRGGSLIIDGGKTDGTYCEEPALRDAILVVNWATSNLVLKNGAYVKVNAANEVGRLTVNGKMDVSNSKLESYQYIAVNQGATFTLNAGSVITTKELTGVGVINVDATGFNGEAVTVIAGNLSGFTGTINVLNNDYAGYAVTEAGLVIQEKTLSGEGTEANPYLINNIADLNIFRDKVNSGDTKYSAPGVHVALGADIDMTGINWVGIGTATAEHGFMGNFDGKDFKIKNLTIDNPALDSDGYAYAGLFGVTEGTNKDNQNVIKNLTIENVTINTTGKIVAAAIAYPYYTNVDNVKVCGNIAITGGDYTAGVLAYTRRCVNASNLSIIGEENSFVKGAQVVGGVISDIQMNGGLKAEYSNFSAQGVTISGTKNVGGISGIIATQTLNGATVKNVTLNCDNTQVGTVAGCLGGTSTISNVVVENVAGATAVVGVTYDGAVVEARVGDTYYATLEAALAAEGNEVTLLAPITVAADETLVLDLQGKTLSHSKACTASYQMVNNKGNLTIKNGKLSFTDTGAGDASFDWGSYTVRNEGTLVVEEDATIEHLGAQAFGTHMICAIYQYCGSTTINGGTISTPNYRSARLWKGDMTINGGKFEGQLWVQAVDNTANLVINGGEFAPRGNDGSSVFVTNNQYNVQLAVTGGKFATKIGCSDATKLAGCVTGGSFTQAAIEGTNSALVALGYVFGAADENGYSTLVDDPSTHYIANVEQLKAFAADVNAGNTYAGVAVRLAADIDLNNEQWTAIGTNANPFKGTFDGQGHTISNLKCVLDHSTQRAALFGQANNAVIKNVNVKNVECYGLARVAAIVGGATTTTVENCHVTGTINLKGCQYVGAIVGYGYVTVKNCSVTGTAENVAVFTSHLEGCTTPVDNSHNQMYIGGIVGWMGEGNSSITGCSVSYAKVEGWCNLGGITGLAHYGNNVTNCTVSNVTVTGNSAMDANRLGTVALVAGGCAGTTTEPSMFNNCTVENSAATDGGVAVEKLYGNNPATGGASYTNYVAKIGLTYYESINDAIAAVQDGQTIDLVADVTMSYGAREAFETSVSAVVINGAAHTLTLNQTNSDWSSFGLANNSKLVLNNITINKSGKGATSGAWNTHAIIFSCPVEMNNVVVNNAVAVATDATLNNVAINEANGYYGLWIEANGQTVNVNGGSITATNGGRGIKIADQYIDNAKKVVLNVDGTVFSTAKKAAVLVSSTAGAKINAANVNIESVAEDQVNFVWVDEDWAAHFAAVEVTGATVAQEGIESLVAAITVGEAVKSYHSTFAAAVAAAKAGETIVLLQDVNESVTISKNLTIDGAGKTITGHIHANLSNVKMTVKNVNFNGDNATYDYAIRVDRASSFVAENCTADGYKYSFLYANKSNNNFTIKDVTVTNCANYGVYFASFNNATIENLTVIGAEYGVAAGNAANSKVNIKNSTFDVELPLYIQDKGTGKVTFTFEGVNNMGDEIVYLSEYVKLASAVQVGTTVYGNFAEAFAAAQDGETVKLLSDFNLGLNDVVENNAGQKVLANVDGKNITFDMNGKKITVDHRSTEAADRIFSVICVEDGAGLTVKGNGSIDVTTAVTDANVMPKVAYMFWKRGTTGYLVIEDGNYHMDNAEDSMVYTNGGNIVTVKGGTFILDAVGTRTNGFPWVFNVAGNNVASLNVTGGTYNYDIRKQFWAQEVKLAEGLTMRNNGDGTWSVVTAVATIVGGESYGSIQEAIDAAQDGETVKLLADVAYADADALSVEEKPYSTMLYVQGKNITLDLNGKNIDVEYTGSLLYSVVLVSDGAGLTVTGEGSINVRGLKADGTAAKNVAYVFWKRGTTGYLVIENGTFRMNDAADSMVYTNGDEIVTVNGGTFILDAVASQANGWPVIFNTAGNNEQQIVVNAGTFNYDINHQERPFEVSIAPQKALKKVQVDGVDMWTIVAAQAYVTEKLGDFVNQTGDNEHNVGYATIAEAFAAVKNGETVTILAGEFTQNLTVNKAITVKGETDEEGNNLVTFNGKLSITADGATVENLNFNNSGTAAYVGAKNVTIDGCSLVGSNGLYQSYTSGLVTFKNSYIKGGTYGIHFDGNAGGNIVIENCTVIGWTSFAGTIENVAISGTTFAEGNYNQLRFYQNAQFTDCTFNEKMKIDWNSSEKTGEFNNCSVEGDKELIEILSLSNIATKGLEVTIDGERVCVAAKVDNKYYLSLQAAIDAATEGQTVTILSDIALTEGVTVAADDVIFIDLNGKTVSMETAEAAVAALIKNNGTLTIESSVDGGKLSFVATAPSAANAYASNTISNYGTLTINAGTVENLSAGGACYALDNYAGSTATINGGKLTAEKTAVRVFNWTNGEANAAELNVVGGEIFSNDGYGININAGNAPYVALNISGGTITTNDTDYNLAVYVVNKNSAENFTANISGGTFNGNLALNGVTSTTMVKGNVSVSGGTFDGVICYGEPACQFITGGSYKAEFTEDYLVYGYQLEANAETALYDANWTGRREVVTIVDGAYDEYSNENEIEVGTLTYKRTLSAVNVWQPLYVPFEVPVETLVDLGYEVAAFYDVHFDVLPSGEVDPNSAPDVHILKYTSGRLKANYPYVIKATRNAAVNADGKPELVIELVGATLHSTAEENLNKVESSTTITRFEFAGTYVKATRAEITGDNDVPFYALNTQGKMQKMGPTVKLAPFRVYMSVWAKDGSPIIFSDEAAEAIAVRVIGEENEDGTTTIYDVNAENGEEMIFDLSGRRVLETEKGIYIKDGKKVLVK